MPRTALLLHVVTAVRGTTTIYSVIQMPKNQNPQLLKSGLKIGVTHDPL
jgi:hypothetical protein